MSRTRIHKGVEYAVSDAHPAAEVFGWLPEEELQAMADDIAVVGQKYKIVRLADHRILDGRNRELACRVAGVEPEYRTEDMGEEDAVAFVRSMNAIRRADPPAVRALAVARLRELTGATLKEAAGLASVSERLVSSAAAVLTTPELVRSVETGNLSLKVAEQLALHTSAPVRVQVATAPDPRAAATDALDEAFEELNRDDDEGDGEEPDTFDLPGDDESEPRTGADSEPAPGQSFGEWQKTLTKPKALLTLKPGGKVDPDHRYARTLKAFSALKRAIGLDVAEDETGFLAKVFTDLRLATFKMPFVHHLSGKVENGVQKPPRVVYVGGDPLRRLVRRVGNWKKKPPTAAILKAWAEEVAVDPGTVSHEEDGE